MIQNVIITFDYEVFLGKKTGTLENSVLKPTRQILAILKKNNAKAIFFVDATWLLFLEENFPDDLQLVTNQLKELIKAGSTVELHLHPQWINASKTGNQAEFKISNYYRLHSLSEGEIISLFRKSIELLENITLNKVRCFRAGGHCIQPFENLRIAFEMFGIKYDFSVIPGVYLRGNNEYFYDFSTAPKLPYYPFTYDVNIPVSNGQFVEIPLSTYQSNPLYRSSNRLLLEIKMDRIFGDGKGIYKAPNNFLNLLYRCFSFPRTSLTFDRMDHNIFKFLVKYHFKMTNLLVIISHPKTLSKQGLLNLSYILKKFNTLNSLDLDNLI